MRHTKRISFLLLAGLAVGCATRDETAAAQLTEAKEETKEARHELAHASRDYTHARKAEFVAHMRSELVGIEHDIDSLSAKADRSRGAAKGEAKEKLADVHEKYTAAQKRLAEAENATESRWEEMKDAFGAAYDDLKDSFKQTRHWASDKLDP